jgi:integrase
MMRGKRRKAQSGEGGVYQRKDGRFDAYITVQAHDGSKVLRTTKRTKKEAREWLNEKRHQRDKGTLPSHDADRITVGAYLDRWLKTIHGTVARHTHKDYESKVRVHLKPAIGRIKLKDLRADDLQVLYAQKTAAGKSARTVEYIHTTIRKALERAEAWDLVTKNVARHAKPPKKGHTEHDVLSRDQVRRFFEAAQGDRFEALYILALTTGMRRGEILGLKWADIDLRRGYLRVLRSLSTDHGPPVEVAPKREASKRPVKLMPEAVSLLCAHKKRQLEERLRAGPRWEDNGYVFPTTVGTGMSGNNLRNRSLRPLLERAGLPPLTFHELRHTFATLELEIGTPAKVVQEILGHASIKQTLDTYSHVAPSMQEEAADKLREHLFGGS